MEKQYIKALIEKATDTGYSFIASTADIDRQGDSIDQSGWDVSEYLKNPVMLWAHDYSAAPVARALSINPADPRGMVGTCEFASAEGNPFAAQLKVLVDEGFVSALSVGFMPLERNGNIITKAQLLEISFVPVPANQNALMLAAKSLEAKGFAADVVKSFMDSMTAKEEGDEEADIDTDETTEEGEEGGETVEAAAEVAETKGAVADEINAEEDAEAKWAKLDEFFEIVGAFVDVYLDEQTPVESFSGLVSEVASLMTALAGTDGADDDENAAQTNALRKLVAKTVSPEARKEFLIKIGAQHSAATKSAIAKAIEHSENACAVLKGLVADGETSIEDEKSTVEAETATIDADEITGLDAARTLLEVRGVLRESVAGEQSALTIINRHLKARE